ncbi:birA, biotin-(acetyl-CoA-carboxylase) ligase [Desulfosporosinus orientis DSM 765]|uniref:Bifunctional ligase/repressor BirA n=1 Tax=Desulfosporosinus orientis (strain ATCC 19365 / DSM 765 / NCIMB 8382 / VKM B-1628 / Singapore I) TaxID=768706 RepID=G7W4X6_DESOD|nr:biotin--[acetyl-CoA-carboxylase] ligase [Desulfosporosinus orientis]AET65848.1 birA, biotin-(acetyl-CoA-carboxylase) ligase [Desulfosporosinus orientis DSM 765]
MLRHDILNLLTERPSENVSGEKISQQLNVTRAAIWKQIKILKEEGFDIEAQPKNGYRLIKSPLSLNEWVLGQVLNTQSLGRVIELNEDLPSTNERAKELARQGTVHGQIVLAKKQSLGKGRLQRQWESPEGGLWMSIVLRPNLSLADATKITLAASVAVVDALKELVNLPVGIKWPNDIVFNGQKIAGILGEVVGEWNVVQTLILGIGVNVNFPRQRLGDSFSAVTLYELLGYELDLNILAAEILKYLEGELISLEHKEFQELRQKWSERAIGLGEEVRILRGDQVLEGIFKGISIDGSLLLETVDGEKSFSAGEVRLRSKQGVYF